MLEEILSIAEKQVDSAELYYLENKLTPVKFENNNLKNIETKETTGVALRVIKNGKIGFSSTTDLEPNKFQKLVDYAVLSAEYGDNVDFNFPSNKIPNTDLTENNKVSLDSFVNIGNEIISGLKEKAPTSLNGVSLNQITSREIVMNSNGVSGHRDNQMISLFVDSQVIDNEDMLDIYDGTTAATLDKLNYLDVSENISLLRKRSKAIFDIETKQIPIICTPKGLKSLLVSLEPSLDGRNVLEGSSFLKGKVDQKIFDERLSIIENPKTGVYNLDFDDEGNLTNKKSYIENGVLKNFFYDLKTSKIASLKPTGNGFRSGISDITSGAINFVFSEGDKSFDEMVSEIDQGIIVDQVLGAGQGNILAGEFSLNVSLGFLIEKGKIVGRVKNCMVAGNIFDLLNDIKFIENKSIWAMGSKYKLPSICFNNINVSSKK